MSSRKRRKKNIIDDLFGGSAFNEMEDLLNDFPKSGYSISVTQTPEGTKVRAKVGKDTNVTMLKKQLQQQYPNAEIEIEGGKRDPLIREISTKSLTKKDEEEQTEKSG